MWVILAVLVIATIICCVYFSNRKSRVIENYGGAVKRIHRIPKNSCYNICEQYYRRCMAEFQYIDAGDCARRYNNCLSVCNYTDFHRL